MSNSKTGVITKIEDEMVHFRMEDDTEVELCEGMFDSSYIDIGNTVELIFKEDETIDIPYGISYARRRDITEHHHEEAMCGNI